MARLVEIVLQVDDRGTANIKRLSRTTRRETGRMARKAESDFARMQVAAVKNIDKMTTRFLKFAKFGAGIFGVIATGAVVKFGASFEATMSGVRAVTQASEGDFRKLTDQARELGATTQFTAVQAASAMEELGKAGFETTELLGVMPDVLNLAAAGELEMAEAASIASDVIRIMGLEISDFTDATDVMAKTAISSKTTIQELGFAYQDAAPVARSLGITFKDLNLLLGTLANRGFVATRSGTALRRIFSVFLGDLEEGEKGLGAYNVQVAKTSTGTTDLVATFENLVDAGLSAGEVMEAFGLRGGPAALNIISSLGLEVEGLEEKLAEFAGTGGRVAETRIENLRGDGLKLLSAVQELALVFFDEVGPSLREAAQGATELVREWASAIKISDAISGLSTLFKVAKGVALAYGIVIGVGLVRRFQALISKGILPFIAGNDAVALSLFRTESAMVALTAATWAQRLAFLGVAGAVGFVAYKLTRAISKATGLDGAMTKLFDGVLNRSIELELAEANLEGVSSLILQNAAKIEELGFDLDLGDDIQEVERQLRIITGQALELSNRAQARAQENILHNQDALLEDQRALVKELDRLRRFGLSATDEQLAAFRGFWEEAGKTAADTAGQIQATFALMKEAIKVQEAAAEEAKRQAEERAKALVDANELLADAFGEGELAITSMGEALVEDFNEHLKAAELIGTDVTLVYRVFGEVVNDTIEALIRSGERVPAALYDIGIAAMEFDEIRRRMAEPIEQGPIVMDPLTETQVSGPEPMTMGVEWDLDEDAFAAELDAMMDQARERAMDLASVVGPPDPSPWFDFLNAIDERRQDFMDNWGASWAAMTQQAAAGFSNLIGTVVTGQEDILKGLGKLAKQMLAQAVSMLVQYAIQRFVIGKLIQKQQAAEATTSFAKGLAEVYLNTFASVSGAPWPFSLAAPFWAMTHQQAAAAGTPQAAAQGAALGPVVLAGGGQAGGLIRRRTRFEVEAGEGSQPEAIIPLRGNAAEQVRRELFRGQETGQTINLSVIFQGDNWRTDGIDRELTEVVMDGIDAAVRRGRGFALATEAT